jgi:TonB family protein
VSSFYVPPESLLESRVFRRLLVVSVVLHVVVYVALFVSFRRRGELIAAAPVMVQIVQMPKTAPAPKAAAPAPKPPPPKPPEPPKEKAPPPPPPPPKPVVKEIVIPKEMREEKPKAVPKPVEKKPETPPPSAAELLQKMTERVEQQEAANKPPDAPETEGPAAAAPTAGRFDPLLSPWIANVQARVRANWSGASVCTGEPEFDVDLDAAGHVTHLSLSKSSGDKYCDDTAERALRKSDPLPPPPRGGDTFTLTLNPKDTQ